MVRRCTARCGDMPFPRGFKQLHLRLSRSNANPLKPLTCFEFGLRRMSRFKDCQDVADLASINGYYASVEFMPGMLLDHVRLTKGRIYQVAVL